MNDDELNPRDGEDTNSGEDTGINTDGRRPNSGVGSAGPKKPGNSGGTGQYSAGDEDETSTESTPVEREDEDADK